MLATFHLLTAPVLVKFQYAHVDLMILLIIISYNWIILHLLLHSWMVNFVRNINYYDYSCALATIATYQLDTGNQERLLG